MKNAEKRSFNEKMKKWKNQVFQLFDQFLKLLQACFFLIGRWMWWKNIFLEAAEYSEALEISVGPNVHET